jgi:hypothetical protein
MKSTAAPNISFERTAPCSAPAMTIRRTGPYRRPAQREGIATTWLSNIDQNRHESRPVIRYSVQPKAQSDRLPGPNMYLIRR